MLPGRVATLRNTCLTQPILAASPYRARSDPHSRSSASLLGTRGGLSSLGLSRLDRLPNCKHREEPGVFGEAVGRVGGAEKNLVFGILSLHRLQALRHQTRLFTSLNSFYSSVKRGRC